MNFVRKSIIILSLLLSACGPQKKYPPIGDFKISSYKIEAQSAAVSDSECYTKLKAELDKKFPSDFKTYFNKGRAIDMTILIKRANFDNTTLALVDGNEYSIWAILKFWDANTNAQIGEGELRVTLGSEATMALHYAINGKPVNYKQQKEQSLIDNFQAQLLRFLRFEAA